MRRILGENSVRAWVAKLQENNASYKTISLNWAESAHGSTSGRADLDCSLNGTTYPIELKAWARLKNGKFAARMEPTQIRWHYVMAARGARTLLLWGELDTDCLWALSGAKAPRTVVSQLDAQECFFYRLTEPDAFLADLDNRRFWWQSR